MNGFRLIGIRPLKNCPPQLLKNLKEGMVYSFYSGYKYYVKDINGEYEILSTNYDLLKDKKIWRIEPPKVKIDLYSKDDLSINVSAVVGKNGSGKSSLTELFFKYLFELSIKNLLKKDPNKWGEHCIDLNAEISNLSQEQQNVKSSKIHLGEKYSIEEFEEEIDRINKYNEFDNDINKIHVIERDLLKNSILNHIEVYYEIDGIPTYFNFSQSFPFYSIVINHSSYSLNSEIIGQWIEKLFHKNDGYETPIVLNPMRTYGNIDSNNEAHLNKTRLLLNLEVSNLLGKEIQNIQFSRDFPNLTDGRTYHDIYQILTNENYFSIDGNEFHSIKVKNGTISGKLLEINKREIEYWIRSFSSRINECFPEILVLKAFDKIDLSNVEGKKTYLKIMLFRYLQFKLIKYAKFRKDGRITSNGYQIKNLTHLLLNLKEDTSHQTFKLFQILHLLSEDNFNNFFQSLESKNIKEDKIELNIDQKAFAEYRSTFKFLKDLPIEMEIFKVPAAFFTVNFQFQNESKFEQLSSGEIQFLNSINQVTYHLRNIDSINYSYDIVNIIFDEVELYFHVEFQRMFISKLIDAIQILNLKRIKRINILFLTHSPFILSDIPSQNILRLDNGVPEQFQEEQKTFGANIHDLLANDFFLHDGFMGEFAKKKIKDLISFLNYHINNNEIKELERKNSEVVLDFQKKKIDALVSENKFIIEELKINTSEQPEKIQLIIETIGEPILKFKLNEMYDLAFKSESNA